MLYEIVLHKSRDYRFGLPLVYLLHRDICLTMPKRRKTSLGRCTASAIRARLRRKRETSLERECRLTKDRVRAATRREFETAAEREYRLAMDRARAASRRERGREREEKAYRLDRVRDVVQREREEIQIRLFLDRVRREIQAQSSASGVQEQTECVLPDVPSELNFDIVKKESIEYTEENVPSAAQNISAVQDWSSSTQYQKSDPCDDSVDDIIIPVNPDDIAPLETSTDITDSSSTSTDQTCTNSTELTIKNPSISLSSLTSNTEMNDGIFEFGDFVADKICSSADKSLRVGAQHSITNMLCEMEMKGLNKDSFPVINKISSLQKPLSATMTLPSNSNIRKHSSCQLQLPPTMVVPPAISKIPSLQTQIPATPTFRSSSVNKSVSLQSPMSATVTPPSSSTGSTILSLDTQLPAAVTLPSNSKICENSKLQARLTETVTLPFCSTISENSSLQTSLTPTMTLPSPSAINTISNLQNTTLPT